MILFQNRIEAGLLLAERLKRFRGQDPLVLAIPGGGVPVARAIAEALEGELDLVLVSKIAAPLAPEAAVGSVSESGDVHLDETAAGFGITEGYLASEANRARELLQRRREGYCLGRACLSAEGRITLVVDDGVATGTTMVAALYAVQARLPKKLVAAMAVAHPSALLKIQSVADEVEVLATPQKFVAVAQFFCDFDPVDDEAVRRTLLRSAEHYRASLTHRSG